MKFIKKKINILIERLLNIETAKFVKIDSGVAEDNNGYEPVTYWSLFSVLWQIKNIKGKIFLDIGCGKGRALFIACLFPFRKVLGYESEPMIYSALIENIKSLRLPNFLKGKIEVFAADATSYSFSLKADFFYLYNPFGPEPFQKFIENLKKDLQQTPREVFILYRTPIYCGQIEKELRPQEIKIKGRFERNFKFYRIQASAGGANFAK